MHKAIYSKDYRWYLGVDTFNAKCKCFSRVHRTGIHVVKTDRYVAIYMVVHRARVVVSFPRGRG